MTRTEEARGRLVDVLTPLMPAGRVQRYCPDQVVAPGIWIDQESRDRVRESNVVTTVVTFPIVIVADGAGVAQQRTLTAVADAVWDAANTVGRCLRSTPGWRDPGAPQSPASYSGPASLRAVTIEVELVITARTLCEEQPETVPAWPLPLSP